MVRECDVNGRNIDARIDTTGTEAEKICAGAGSLLMGVTNFTEPWQLRIFSPFSGNHPLATCSLPQGSSKTSAPGSASTPSKREVTTPPAPASSAANANSENDLLPLFILLAGAFIVLLVFLIRAAKRDKPKLMREDALSQKICVQCYQTGKARLPGSGLIELILWCCYLVPGLLYSIWRRGKGGFICPYCKTSTMVPLHSPAGQQILAKTTSGGR